jgi:hypothetical protein
MKSLRGNNIASTAAKPLHKTMFTWVGRILACISILFSVIFLLLLLGVLIPFIPYVGVIGTLLESFFSLHLVIASLIFGLLAYAGLRLEDPRKHRRLMKRSMSRITLPSTALPLLLSPVNMITRSRIRVKCNSSII